MSVIDEKRAGGLRAVARCDALGAHPYSDMTGGLFRPFLGPGYRASIDCIASWMREAGMTTRVDPMGSLVGRYEGLDPGAPTLLIGSHIDSVRDGGRYDGALGVMLGIECIATLSCGAARMPFPIEIVACGDEEGSRFPVSMLCSKALVAQLPDGWQALVDADGISMTTAFAAAGLDVARGAEAARPPDSLLAYLEAHIEQGPVLDRAGEPLAVVDAIAGIERFEVALSGVPGHAGTVPMSARTDALAAASEAVLAIEAVGRSLAPGIVSTVGRMSVLPGSVNVIPGRATFPVEVRSGDDVLLDQAVSEIGQALERIAQSRGVALAIGSRQRFAPTRCDPGLATLLDNSMREAGLVPRRLVSGAGHDAMMLANAVPSIMLFVRCRDGISHHPAEAVEPDDVQVALDTMIGFIRRLAGLRS